LFSKLIEQSCGRFNRVAFGGTLSSYFFINIPDVNKREFVLLLTMIIPTVLLGIYPSPILDGLHYSVSYLIYAPSEFSSGISCAVIFISILNKFKTNYPNIFITLFNIRHGHSY